MADYDLQYQDTYIDALLATANELKTAGYIYKGVATPSTNPGTPTERVAYLASEPGTYTNFGGIVIASGLYSLTYASGTWTGTQMSAGSDIEVAQTTGQSTSDVMSQKAVTDEVTEPKSVDLSGETLEVGFFSATGTWGTTSGGARTIFLPVLPNEKYIMTASASQNFYTILHSMFDTTQAQAQADIDYATGYSTRVQLAQGASVALTIPSDGYFLAFRADLSSGNSFAPALQKLVPIKEEIKDNFNRIGERRKIVLPNAITLGGWISNTTFKWATRSTTYFSIIPVIGGKRMHWVYDGGGGQFHYAWLTDFDMIGQRNVTAGGTPSYVAGTSLVF
jgi:hypothetical protein